MADNKDSDKEEKPKQPEQLSDWLKGLPPGGKLKIRIPPKRNKAGL